MRYHVRASDRDVGEVVGRNRPGCRGRRRDPRIPQVGSGITTICGEAGTDGRRWSLALYSPRRRAPFLNDLRKDRLG
jgi:hypothetical protein